MLDLRTLDPARQTADRRVALAIGYGGLAAITLGAVAAGGGERALVIGIVFAIAGLPWMFAFNGRWRLLEDAIAGVPFAWRGDRAGVWSTAPIGGALLALLFSVTVGLPGALALLATIAGAVGYTAALWQVEQRYERLILLELTALEHRFERITDARANRSPRPAPDAGTRRVAS